MNYKDNEQEAVRKTWAGEKAKLAQMSFGQKLEYIWAYYKLHIGVVLLICIVLGWCIHHALTYVDYKFYGMIINSGEFNSKAIDDLHDDLGMVKHDGVNVTADLYTDEMANMNGYGNRLDIYVMAGQLDFAFTDKEGAEHLAQMGAVRQIGDVVPDNLMNEWADADILNTAITDDAGEYFDAGIAVDISNSPIHEYFGLADNINYLVIADLSGNEEYMSKFYDLLYDIETGKR